MVFSSSLFLLYFIPVFLLGYALIDARYRKLFTIFASVFFFAWGAPMFSLIILISLGFDYLLLNQISGERNSRKKWMFRTLVLVNIAMLVYFKYTGFLISNLNPLLTLSGIKAVTFAQTALPLGVSFIVFQKLAFFIDFYRGKIKPESLSDYFFHILMFPKLLAGPIVRFSEMSETLSHNASQTTADMRLSGFFRFSVGLAKKVLIANILGDQVNVLFALPQEQLYGGILWIAALAYTFQIYFDFSGYSDMAIGLALMMGFRFPENFNNPYTARSITEFWRRWHMTLSNWLRDYVFLPVAYAASRRLKANRYLNVKTDQWLYMLATMVTMFICGFWHGAAWTFIIWGIYQGILMVMERLFLLKLYKRTRHIVAVPFTFFFTIIGWMLFRADSVRQAAGLIRNLISFSGPEVLIHLNSKFYTILVLAFLFSFAALIKPVARWQESMFRTEKPVWVHGIHTFLALLLFILSVSAITASGFNPFIYFRF